MNVILEYSEEQQAFHNNRGDSEENTCSYKTLGEINEDWAFGFVQYIRRYFVFDILTFEEVKKLFNKYNNIQEVI